jgi:hypothetical protein
MRRKKGKREEKTENKREEMKNRRMPGSLKQIKKERKEK